MDLNNQSGATQERQFGFNCDFIGWYPLPYFVRWNASRWGGAGGSVLSWLGAHYNRLSRRPARRALLAVNHEYTSGNEMFPNYDDANPTYDQVEAEIAAHGMSVVEIELRGNEWRFVMGSPFNRRITGSTPIETTGPLSGHKLLQTANDSDGKTVLGMLSNCAGGKTPWGTVLTCEEKFDPLRREANMDLLDHGTLYVAKFNDDGTGEWLPLPKSPESIINTRGTADSLGATKMDRPEDVDVSPVTGKVYVAMTKNKKRGVGESEGSQTDPGVDAANPRDDNRWGHIIEISEGDGLIDNPTSRWPDGDVPKPGIIGVRHNRGRKIGL